MYDVIVVGGGIAGCSSAIQLSSLGKKVLLLERGKVPAHKICGEFLSTEVASMLNKLGLLDAIISGGASPINSVLLTTLSGGQMTKKLPGTAYGFSRYEFDRLLYEKASEMGVDCRKETAVLDIEGSLDIGFVVKTEEHVFESRMVIGAYGKKAHPVHEASPKPTQGHYVAYKQHYIGPGPIDTVEVHVFDRGYCGINTVEDGIVNVCWLAHRSLLNEHGGKREAVAQSVLTKNLALSKRLAGLTPVEGTLCAIGGVSLASKGRFLNDISLIGDSSQMIAPFCGDGMGMALRSSEVAAPLCAAFLDGTLTREQFVAAYSENWKHEFGQRIALGKILQQAALSTCSANVALSVLTYAPKAVDWLLTHTRGSAPNSSTQPSIVNPGPKASPMPNP